MSQSLLDTADTGDITLSRPAVYRQPRRANPMAWWWASALITTVGFLVLATVTLQYAGLRGTGEDVTWDVLRMLTGILSIAAVASWTAAALAHLVIARTRKLTEVLLDVRSRTLDGEGRYVQGFADGAVGRAPARLKTVD